ncbi:hypothetical protein BH09PLA1_BH09PLA1_18400 [soil metagenome]
MSVYKPAGYASHIIKFRIGRRYRKFPGLKDKGASRTVEGKIKLLIAIRASHEPMPPDLQSWLLELPSRLPSLHEKLIVEGLLPRSAADSARPLSELLYGVIEPAPGFEDKLKLYHRNGNTDDDARRKVMALHPELYSLKFVGWMQCLMSKGRPADYALLRTARARRMFDGCGFKQYEDIDGNEASVWLANQRKEVPNFGHTTSNHHLKAARSFVKWARKTLAREHEPNPLSDVATMNEKEDIRRKRRAPSADEFKRLMKAVRKNGTICGLPAADRAMLYRVAQTEALRAGECYSLVPESFQFTDTLNEVVVIAAYSKHRREDHVPIPTELLRPLRKWLKNKTPGEKLWTGNWIDDPADMLRRDLEAAKIDYHTPDGYFDFHATRHGGITIGSRTMSLVHLMKFARHGKAELTLRYTHTSREELHEAAADLPAPDQPRVKKSTGPASSGNPGHQPDQKSDHAAFAAMQRLSSDGIACPCCQIRISPDFVRAYAMSDTSCHQRARRDSNPQPPDRQSGTLTN